MSSSAVVPSKAQLLEKIKAKLKNHDQVLWPAVSEKIQFHKARKLRAARTDPTQEYRTVFHVDLHRALMTGSVTDVGQAIAPIPGWAVTVLGLDSGGEPLVVMVHVCLEDCKPLCITDFTIPQKKEPSAE